MGNEEAPEDSQRLWLKLGFGFIKPEFGLPVAEIGREQQSLQQLSDNQAGKTLYKPFQQKLSF